MTNTLGMVTLKSGLVLGDGMVILMGKKFRLPHESIMVNTIEHLMSKAFIPKTGAV